MTRFALLLAWALPACSGAPAASAPDSVGGVCRGGTSALRDPSALPSERTVEPCNGLDDDGDGITDPHCPDAPCEDHSDCTYGGLVPDADCNPYPDGTSEERRIGRAGCNQIDGVLHPDARGSPSACWGVLCPHGLKCVDGDCVAPGDLPPCAPCTHGSQCPAHAGCIPDPGADTSVGRCLTYCHEFPCPEGFLCREILVPAPGGATVHTLTCLPEGQDDCGTPFPDGLQPLPEPWCGD